MVLQKAENFQSDCFRSNLCLFFAPNLQAAASIFMSAQFQKVDLVSAVVTGLEDNFPNTNHNNPTNAISDRDLSNVDLNQNQPNSQQTQPLHQQNTTKGLPQNIKNNSTYHKISNNKNQTLQRSQLRILNRMIKRATPNQLLSLQTKKTKPELTQ